MVLKFFILYSILFGLGYSSYSQETNPFAHLSKDERMKLADKYHYLSQSVYQTSNMHRMYKDSTLMAVPDHIEYMQRTSYSYKKAGEHIKAMEMLNKAVALDVQNNSTKTLEYRAWSMLYYYRNYENTIKDVDLIEQMNSHLLYSACHAEPCLFLKGQAYYRLDNYTKAIETFEHLLNLERQKGLNSKDDFLTNFYLARSYFKANNLEKAIFYLEEQLQMPYSVKAELNFYLGEIYALKNEKEKALKHFLTSKELYLANDKIYEPFVERFDEIFIEDIESEIQKLN